MVGANEHALFEVMNTSLSDDDNGTGRVHVVMLQKLGFAWQYDETIPRYPHVF